MARARARAELTPRDRVIKFVLGAAAVVPVAALGFLAYEMFKEAYPSIVFNGGKFFTTKTFTIGNLYSTGVEVRHGYKAAKGASFGILPLIFGTLVSSLIALVFALPVSVLGAILLVERVPRRFEAPLGVFLELLAGVPSVVFGLWGVYTFGPFFARDVYRYVADLHIPWLTGAVGSGQGLLTSSLVLAIMIIPIVAATTRELVRSVPALSKEGATALGLTRSESVRLVTLPFIRTGIIAAALLGWGRALGETIAVLLISGNFLNAYPKSIFAPFSTMASTIAALLDGALTDSTGMAIHALAEVGLVLLGITLLTNFAGRLVGRRLSGPGLPVGRGV
ncbi:phosphate ABC transporter permease subunit PstC [Acidiferrimicrobium sp. IK]|uniref:phosphate ABC transporter permease subunit PstC n=1 Tax=Acidiferrimicrobium sp. IK TaxID=2871700 RepID=UPI0021CB1471|nr:phosphate ABC transporter permease subunit PstC [Acidiferrimicrobium sp. IK]MCU4185094.1 phosphate ABC transporter permease subunit PstC [Acidiferrimicrobium sp. IK]